MLRVSKDCQSERGDVGDELSLEEYSNMKPIRGYQSSTNVPEIMRNPVKG
jgi:hypothetical protein